VRALAVLLVSLVTGCGHQTVFFSDAPQSRVTVDDTTKDQGKGFDDPWGGPASINVRVDSDEGAVDFALDRSESTLTPVCAGAACGGVVGAGAGAVGVTSVVWASLVPSATPGCALLAIPAFLVAAGALVGTPALAYALFGRQGPDEVAVSFTDRTVTVRPAAEISRVRWRPKVDDEQKY
jgi:hypothetical protein